MIVTDHGKPTLEVRPYRDSKRNPFEILRGSVVREDDPIEPVAIDAWEICMLVKRGKLILALEVSRWLATVTEIEALRFHPVDVEISNTFAQAASS